MSGSSATPIDFGQFKVREAALLLEKAWLEFENETSHASSDSIRSGDYVSKRDSLVMLTEAVDDIANGQVPKQYLERRLTATRYSYTDCDIVTLETTAFCLDFRWDGERWVGDTLRPRS